MLPNETAFRQREFQKIHMFIFHFFLANSLLLACSVRTYGKKVENKELSLSIYNTTSVKYI